MTVRETASQAAAAIGALNDLTSEGADFAGLDDVRGVIASLERLAQDLPHLCEQLARILVVQHEEGRIESGADPGIWVTEAVGALAAAGQAADMMTASLTQARNISAQLKPGR